MCNSTNNTTPSISPASSLGAYQTISGYSPNLPPPPPFIPGTGSNQWLVKGQLSEPALITMRAIFDYLMEHGHALLLQLTQDTATQRLERQIQDLTSSHMPFYQRVDMGILTVGYVGGEACAAEGEEESLTPLQRLQQGMPEELFMLPQVAGCNIPEVLEGALEQVLKENPYLLEDAPGEKFARLLLNLILYAPEMEVDVYGGHDFSLNHTPSLRFRAYAEIAKNLLLAQALDEGWSVGRINQILKSILSNQCERGRLYFARKTAAVYPILMNFLGNKESKKIDPEIFELLFALHPTFLNLKWVLKIGFLPEYEVRGYPAYYSIYRAFFEKTGIHESYNQTLTSLSIEPQEFGQVEYNEAFRMISRNGNLDLLCFLMKFGESNNLSISAYIFNEAFEWAVNAGKLEVLQYLAENGAYRRFVDQQNFNKAFESAIFAGRLEIIQYLAKNGANGQFVDQRNLNRAFNMAASYGKLEVVQYLAENGTNGLSVDQNSLNMSFEFAVSMGRLAIVEYLAKHGANNLFVNQNNLNGAFVIAASRGHLLVVQYLAKNGANGRFIDQRNLNEAFDTAAVKGHLLVVQYLAENGTNGLSIDQNGLNAAFQEAALKGRWETVQYLAENGAGEIRVDQSGLNAAFQEAALKGSLETVQYFAKNGVRDLSVDQNGLDTAFGEAAACGHLPVVEYLALNGAGRLVLSSKVVNKSFDSLIRGDHLATLSCFLDHFKIVPDLSLNSLFKAALYGWKKRSTEQDPEKKSVYEKIYNLALDELKQRLPSMIGYLIPSILLEGHFQLDEDDLDELKQRLPSIIGYLNPSILLGGHFQPDEDDLEE